MSECQGDLMSATGEVDASWRLVGGESTCGATVLQNHARVMDVGRNTVRRALAAGGPPMYRRRRSQSTAGAETADCDR